MPSVSAPKPPSLPAREEIAPPALVTKVPMAVPAAPKAPENASSSSCASPFSCRASRSPCEAPAISPPRSHAFCAMTVELVPQKRIELLDQRYAEVINKLLCIRCKAVIQRGQHPLSYGCPVLFLYGGTQCAKCAQYALVGLCFPALHQPRKAAGRCIFYRRSHLRGPIGSNGLHLFYRGSVALNLSLYSSW